MKARRWQFTQLLYNLLLLAAIPLLCLYLLLRRLKKKPVEGWSEHMGYLPRPAGEPVAWFHAVSAGEAVAAEAVIRALKAREPKLHVICTVGTAEGRATAQRRMADVVDAVAYVPYDFPWMVARALDRVRPRLLVLVESELWPNLIQAAAARGASVLVANGYVSEGTWRRGRRLRFLYRWIFGNIRMHCAQSDAVRARALELGALPDRVIVAGNVKYDQAPAPLSTAQTADWRELLGLRPADAVLVAGSTHPGEEPLVLEAYRLLLDSGAKARLILAPRHPQRAEEVEALARAAGFAVVRRSRLEKGGEPPDPAAVILLDTMGELASVFTLATVVFLGGSLMPIGGHDILQPLMAGKPVLLGPHWHRQREIVREALDAAVVWEVSGPAELAQRAGALLRESPLPEEYARRAVEFVTSRRGASERCAAEAVRLLRAVGQEEKVKL